MSRMILMVGNIGTGKSFLASKFAKNGAVVVNMDAIQSMVSGGDYDRYRPDKKPVYAAIEEETIMTALRYDMDIVVDRTNINKKTRQKFIRMAKLYQHHIVAVNFGAGTDSESFRRRIENGSRGVPEKTWEEVYIRFKNEYEAPTEDEGIDLIIKPPEKYVFHAFDFDGTIVSNEFPGIGKINGDVISKMMLLWNDLSNVIIVWTCRSGDYLNQARQFLIQNNIPFDFINTNPLFENGSRKIFAHYYYDDRNCGGLVVAG